MRGKFENAAELLRHILAERMLLEWLHRFLFAVGGIFGRLNRPATTHEDQRHPVSGVELEKALGEMVQYLPT